MNSYGEKEYRIYILDGETILDEEFTSEDIVDNAIDFIEGESPAELLMEMIDRLNNSTLSDENWYIMFHRDDYMNIISNLPENLIAPL